MYLDSLVFCYSSLSLQLFNLSYSLMRFSLYHFDIYKLEIICRVCEYVSTVHLCIATYILKCIVGNGNRCSREVLQKSCATTELKGSPHFFSFLCNAPNDRICSPHCRSQTVSDCVNSVLHLLMTMMTHVTPALSPLAYIPTVCMDLYCDTAEGVGTFFVFGW